MLAAKIEAFFDQRNRRIGRDFVEHDGLRATGVQCILNAAQQTEFRNHVVGDDQNFAVAKARNHLAHARTAAWANHQRRLGNRDKTGDFTRAFHQRLKAGGASGFGDEIEDHSSLPFEFLISFSVGAMLACGLSLDSKYAQGFPG